MAVEGQGNSIAPDALFTQVRFYIVQGPGLKAEDVKQLSNVLKEHGATEFLDNSNSTTIPLDKLTHLISTTSDFPQYDTAVQKLLAVVKPDWVHASLSKNPLRLANTRQYSPDPKLFFSGLVVCCADLPSGDKDAIIGGVLAMGGLYSSPVTKMVTHIVALNTASDKCQTVLNKNLKCKLVLPHWFDDCLKLGRRIDEGPYMLPDPEILRKRPEDFLPDGIAKRPDMQGASSIQPGILPTPASSPGRTRRDLTVLKGKRVMLSNDLDINSHLRGTIEDLINDGSGSVTGSVEKADIFICQYREGLDYRIASRAGRDVGNLNWLYHLFTHNSWTNPLRRLLHYPIARNGLPGFKDFRVSLSNYSGEARVYLENLAKAAGCEFTKTMKEDNTHLITAHTVSEKCDAAKEWNIHMVNHLWLEESYAKWHIQSVSNTRYTHFPARTNLGEVVGQTQIDRKALERHFFPEGSDVELGSEHRIISKPMQQKDQNVVASRLPNSSAAPSSSSAAKSIDNVPHRSVVNDQPTPRAAKGDRRQGEGPTLKTPVASRYAREGKENETPSTTGSRGAKDRAAAKIHNLAPDIALYEKEKKRVGGVIFGGRKNNEDKDSDSRRKRSASFEDSIAGDDFDVPDAKRSRKSAPPVPATMKLLITGYKKWIDAIKKENEDRGKLRELGIQVVQDPAVCTHVASPNLLRTQKFLCALAYAPTVISTDFVDDCISTNERLEAEDYALNDVEGEKRLGMNLAQTLTRAKANKRRLLHGYNIYCTETIHGGFDTYKSIIDANGGKCFLYRARAASNTSSRTTVADGATEGAQVDALEYLYLLSGQSPEEARLWPKFRQMAEGLGKTPRIAKTDWMHDLSLSQKVRWLDSYEIKD